MIPSANNKTLCYTANYYRAITDKLRFLSTNVQISVIITDKYQPKQQLHRQMTVDITPDCIWILKADKYLCILQSKHLQCNSLQEMNNMEMNCLETFYAK